MTKMPLEFYIVQAKRSLEEVGSIDFFKVQSGVIAKSKIKGYFGWEDEEALNRLRTAFQLIDEGKAEEYLEKRDFVPPIYRASKEKVRESLEEDEDVEATELRVAQVQFEMEQLEEWKEGCEKEWEERLKKLKEKLENDPEFRERVKKEEEVKMGPTELLEVVNGTLKGEYKGE